MKYFSVERIVPERSLTLPLTRKAEYPKTTALPFIMDGKLINAALDEGVYCLDENSFSNTDWIYKDEGIDAGVFCCGKESVLGCRFEDNANIRIDLKTRESRVFVNSPYSRTDYSLSYNDRYLLYKKGGGIAAVKYLDFEYLWSFKSPTAAPQRYAIDQAQHRVIVLDSDSNMACLDFEDGRVIWSKTADELGVLDLEHNLIGSSSAPHIYGNVIIAGSTNLYIIGVNINDGELLWKTRLKGDANYPCVTTDGKIYKVSGNYYTELDAESGEIETEQELRPPNLDANRNIDLGSAFCDVTTTHVWGITTQGLLYAVNKETAQIDWHDVLGSPFQLGASIIICNNRLYIKTLNSVLIYEGEGCYRIDQQ